MIPLISGSPRHCRRAKKAGPIDRRARAPRAIAPFASAPLDNGTRRTRHGLTGLFPPATSASLESRGARRPLVGGKAAPRRLPSTATRQGRSLTDDKDGLGVTKSVWQGAKSGSASGGGGRGSGGEGGGGEVDDDDDDDGRLRERQVPRHEDDAADLHVSHDVFLRPRGYVNRNGEKKDPIQALRGRM